MNNCVINGPEKSVSPNSRSDFNSKERTAQRPRMFWYFADQSYLLYVTIVAELSPRRNNEYGDLITHIMRVWENCYWRAKKEIHQKQRNTQPMFFAIVHCEARLKRPWTRPFTEGRAPLFSKELGYHGRLVKRMENFGTKYQFNRLQMVHFECPRVRNPCVSLRFGELHFPISAFLSGVLRIGLPSIKM